MLLRRSEAGLGVPAAELLRRILLALPRVASPGSSLSAGRGTRVSSPSKIMEFDSLGAIVASISAGMGVGFIPASAVASFTAGSLLRSHAAPDRYGLATVRFAWRRDRRMDRGLQAFVDLAGRGMA